MGTSTSTSTGASMTSGLTRRRALTLLCVGAGTAAVSPSFLPTATAAAATAATTCSATATDQQEVGPYYVNEGLVRSNIVSGEGGIPLTFTLTVIDPTTCEPFVGAAVDVWQANALGVYSDESSENTTGVTYLRGIQITDDNGQVTFTTIYPGWYSGRTVHIHAKIRRGGTLSGTSYTGGTDLWIGQFFFPEADTAAVAQVSPYSTSTTTRTTNSTDRVYTQQNGDETLLTVTGSTSSYAASSTLEVAADGSTSSGTTACTIDGATTRATRHGSTVSLTGTAAATSSVELFFHAYGSSGYTQRATVTATSSGTWAYSYVSATSYAIYAESEDNVSDVHNVLLRPSINNAARVTMKKAGRIALTGYSVPSTVTTLKVKRTSASAYTSYSLGTNSKGDWTKFLTVSGDTQYYVVGKNGLASGVHTIDIG